MILRDYESPCGNLLLGVSGSTLCICDWLREGRAYKTIRRLKNYIPEEKGGDNLSIIENASLQLDEYFEGERKVFDLPLSLFGTDFQRMVWNKLNLVDYGNTLSYKKLAVAIGNEKAVRAVANAVGANPLSIIIPCHRVIGSDNSTGGYAGGIEAKRHLLELEQRN